MPKIILIMAVSLLSIQTGEAKARMAVSTSAVIAAIELENINRGALNAIKQLQSYDEACDKASAQHKKMEAKLKALDGRSTAEKQKLTAEIVANRQLQAGCLRGKADSYAALIHSLIQRTENMTKAHKAMSLERSLIEAEVPTSKKEAKEKARRLADIDISQAKIIIAIGALVKHIDYLGVMRNSAKSLAFFIDPDALANIKTEIENKRRAGTASE